MRSIYLPVLVLLLMAPLSQALAGDAAVNSASKAGFVKELPLKSAQKLLGAEGTHIFVAQQDSTVEELDQDGHTLLTLQSKDMHGAQLLKQPEAVAEANGIIYVVDSETNLVAMFDATGKFQGSFGAKRSGFFGGGAEVELSSPHGVAVDDGIVYVSDTGNSRVLLFGINGVFISALEIEGAPENKAAEEQKLPYRLKEPSDIAVNAQGQLYVLDANDGLIKVYSPQGKYLKYLPLEGKALAFALAAEGVYVVDKDSLMLHRYDFDDKMTYSFGAKGEGRGLFKSVSGVAANSALKVLVEDGKKGVLNVFQAETGRQLEAIPKSASRVSIQLRGEIPFAAAKLVWRDSDTLYAIAADNKTIARLHKGVVSGEIKNAALSPVALALDKAGTLWVLDKAERRIVKLDEAGNILGSIGSKGSKKGQLDDPTDMAIASNGNVYVADRGNNWVQVFNSDGGFVRTINKSTSAVLDEPAAIALDPQDNLYVLDKARSLISVFSARGEPLLEFGNATQAAARLSKPVAVLASDDEVMVLDGNQVKVYTHSGQYLRSFAARGNAPGELDEPLALAAYGTEIFAIAERANKRIQLFSTLYKPAAPGQLVAQDRVHAVGLHWMASTLPYIKQYQIYRSSRADSGFVRIGSSSANDYVDTGLAGDEQHYYRVAAETRDGYVGASSVAVQGVAQKFAPARLDAVQAEASPWQLKLSWKPVETQYLGAYVIYQKDGDAFTKIGESIVPEFTKGALKPDTKYTYYVAVRSTDNIESPKCEVTASTLPFNKAPLEIEVLALRDIFSNTYKLYEDEGVGSIRLTNNTDKPLDNIKVSFVLKNVMDFPTEAQIVQILPGQSAEIKLRAVFNNTILTISEDSSVQALIEASYYENGAQVVYGKSSTVKVYDKHRLTWDERGRYAAFITPKDPPIINFARAVATQMGEVKDEAQLAAVVFDGLGVMGLTYLPDPSNPYQISSGKTDTVDYIQYPRETLRRKSGDCDDLVAIYSAALESMGVYTLVIEVPGHMFMMFSTGIDADADAYTNNDLYVVHNGKLWIPVETTIVGNSFVKAWELGAANYYKWKGKGLTILDVHEAWNTFKPATLPESTQAPQDINLKQIDKKFPGDLQSVLKLSSQIKIRGYLLAIAKNPADMQAHLQAGIVLAKLGDTGEAMKYFDKILVAEPKNAAALNNRGNLFMLEANYAAAQRNYLAAAQSNAEDADIWVNLAKAYKAEKNMKKAKEALLKAQQLDGSVKNKYKALALELLNSL